MESLNQGLGNLSDCTRKKRENNNKYVKKFKIFKRHNITAKLEHREQCHLLCSDADLTWLMKSTILFSLCLIMLQKTIDLNGIK